MIEEQAFTPIIQNVSRFRQVQNYLATSTLKEIGNCKGLEVEEELEECINNIAVAYNSLQDEILQDVANQREELEKREEEGNERLENILMEIQADLDASVEFAHQDLVTCIEDANIR